MLTCISIIILTISSFLPCLLAAFTLAVMHRVTSFLVYHFTVVQKIAEGDSELTDLVREARTSEDKHRLLMMLGEVKMSSGRYREAAGVFTDAAGINADASTLQAASNAAERAGDLRAAAEFSRRAAVQTPSAEAH